MPHFTLFVTDDFLVLNHLIIIEKNFLYTNDGVKSKFQFEDLIFLVRYKILLGKNFVNKSGEQDKYRKNRISYKIFQVVLFALPFFVLSLCYKKTKMISVTVTFC